MQLFGLRRDYKSTQYDFVTKVYDNTGNFIYYFFYSQTSPRGLDN